MTHVFSAFRRYFRRSSESGQSIVLLALGFIALAGFVGITTDISLMFVRYAQLSRAVDSAAIAAANQMRQDRSNASVQLAARQFIEFYGLSPEQVIVDTCLTTKFQDADLCTDEQAKLVRVRAYFRQPTVFLRLLGVQSFDMWVAATSQTAALDVVIVMDVSESMAAQTAYSDWANTEKLSTTPGVLVGPAMNYGVIYRPPTTNEIVYRLNATDPAPEITATNLWTVWKNKTAGTLPGLLLNQQIVVNDKLMYSKTGGTPMDTGSPRKTVAQGSTAEPLFRVYYNDTYFPGAVEPPRIDCRVRFYPRAIAINLQDRTRMRGATKADKTFLSYLELLQDPLVNLERAPDIPVSANLKLTDFDGFVPTYNYYGCCNDPDGAGGFDDLVCQPFKQVRNATFDFLERIDFLRGDRAAFVTFDRSAILVNPHLYAVGAMDDESKRPGAMLDDKKIAYHTLKNLIGVRAEPYFYAMKPTGTGPATQLIDKWSGYSVGFNPDGSQKPVDYTGFGAYDPATNPNGYDPTKSTFAATVNYPVQDNCFVQNATLEASRSLFPGGLAEASLPTELARPDTTYFPMGYDTGWKNYKTNNAVPPSTELENVIPYTTVAPIKRERYLLDISYEYWAACRSGNVGAALREANNALLNPATTRRFGTIWIIILMSDGGAGASDPVRRNGALLREADPYKASTTLPVVYGKRGEYGAFGLCPMGTPANPGELVLYGNDRKIADPQAYPPYCADEDPVSRHTCDFRPLLTLPGHPANGAYVTARKNPMQDVNWKKAGEAGGPPANYTDAQVLLWNKQNNHLYDVDIGPEENVALARGGCEDLYDVEDYARDWADYIAIANLGTSSGANAQVPTIFTIGFSLEFTVKTDNDAANTGLVKTLTLPINDPDNVDTAQENVYALCRRNVANCLGEQLLRYIADIGDNNRIDNDFYQDMMYEWYHFEVPGFDPGDSLNFAIDGKVSVDGLTFGTRDACQTQVGLNGQPIIPNNNTYDTDGDGFLKGFDANKSTVDTQGVPNGDGVFNYKDADKRGEKSVNIAIQNSEFGREWGQLRGNVSCGNYYYSPTAEQLQFVFDDIASRMFTRLSR